MAQRIKFIDAYDESEPRWSHRFTLKEEFMRRDQIKQVDKFLKSTKVVYDFMENSPFYKDLDIKLYNEKLLIPTNKDDNTQYGTRFKSRGYRRNIMNSGLQKNDRIYTSLNPYYVVQSDKDFTLVFESRFESGNLRRAIQIDDFEYDLFLRNDYNSQGYIQWYFFKVSNTRKGVKYTFHLKNFFKPDSLYNQGMKILIYSKNKAKEDGVGWYRGGENI